MAAFQDWGDTGLRAREISFNPTTGGINGTTTNDNASAGKVGEYIESVVSATNSPTSNQLGDLTSISLTAGDWDVSAGIYWTRNGSTWQETQIGISTNSGISGTGLVLGSNAFSFDFASTSTAVIITSMNVQPYRLKLTGTTTIYLKFQSVYSGGPPQAAGRLSARRVR